MSKAEKELDPNKLRKVFSALPGLVGYRDVIFCTMYKDACTVKPPNSRHIESGLCPLYMYREAFPFSGLCVVAELDETSLCLQSLPRSVYKLNELRLCMIQQSSITPFHTHTHTHTHTVIQSHSGEAQASLTPPQTGNVLNCSKLETISSLVALQVLLATVLARQEPWRRVRHR